MEEVDGIIAHTLQSIGCDIEEDVQSVSQFSTELVVEGVARCLKVINTDLDLPYKLPPSMSARFRIGSSLASAVQELGYRGEVGYQTFLYSSETDIRKVFIFLLEKLPKEASNAAEESLGASALLRKSISRELSRRLSLPWTPDFCKKSGICWRGNPVQWHREGYLDVHPFHSTRLSCAEGYEDLSSQVSKETKLYYSKHLPYVHKQPPVPQDLAASLISQNEMEKVRQQEWDHEWSTLGMYSRLSPEGYMKKKKEKLQLKIKDQLKQSVEKCKSSEIQPSLGTIPLGTAAKTKGSRFTHIEKLQFAQDEDNVNAQLQAPPAASEEEAQKKREEEVEELRQSLSKLTSHLDQLQNESKTYSSTTSQMEQEIKRLEEEHKGIEEEYKVKKSTLDLLPEADKNMADLQAMVDASTARLVSLAAQWDKKRQPMQAEYEKLKELAQNHMTESQRQLEEIQHLRERMKLLASETRTKEEVYKQLVAEFEKMTKGVNRSAYTRRILEIVSNIKKQKVGIDQVLLDTRTIQKDINFLTGKLDRTFTVTDELIFKDAMKDEAVRKAYKHLAALHENCNLLMKTVEDTGVIMREIRDLEDQLEQESKKKIGDNLDKISNDLQAMKKENATLIAKYKKQNAS